MPLIDRFVPNPHFTERHRTRVRASPSRVIAQAAAYRTESDPFFRRMIAIRELPMRIGHVFADRAHERRPAFGIDDFTPLARSESEIVFGLAGRFWRPDFDLAPLRDGQDFLDLAEPGIAKLALDFSVARESAQVTLLSTQTRILCTDRAAKARFAPYWYIVRPVSGLIRRRILSVIRTRCEAEADRC